MTFCIPFGAPRCIHKGNPRFSEQARDSCSMVNWSSCLVFTRAKQLERHVQRFAFNHLPVHSRAKTTWNQACRKKEHVARLSWTLWAVHARPQLFLFYFGPVKGGQYQDFISHKWIVWRKNTHYQTHFYKKINLLRQMIEKHFVLFMLYRNYHRFTEKRKNDCVWSSRTDYKTFVMSP